MFPLAGRGGDGSRWAYRYRDGGRGSKRVQRGGFDSERAAAEALERLLEQLRRDHAIRLLDTYQAAEALDVHQVDARWTPNEPLETTHTSRKKAEQGKD